MRITPDELRELARFVQGASGICLDASKAYLFETRFATLLQELRCDSFSELHRRVRCDHTGRLAERVIDAITTNETLFFRDEAPFEALRLKLIPELADKGATIRVWSAGCSAGQEVYSIAMVFKEALGGLDPARISLLGTDISPSAVERARAGVYSRFEVERGLSAQRRDRHFVRHGAGWRVRDDLRSVVSFEVRNLLHPFSGGAFDIVFCRYVAIYFSPEERLRLFARIAGVMKPHGSLFVGGSELLSAIPAKLAPRHHSRARYYAIEPEGIGRPEHSVRQRAPDPAETGRGQP